MSSPWQEEDGGPGEIVLELGLFANVRVTLDLEDLEHLRRQILASDAERVLARSTASEDYA